MTVIVLAVDKSEHSRAAASWVASSPALASPRIVHLVHVSPVLGRTGFSAVEFEQENRDEARLAFAAAHDVLQGQVQAVHDHWLHGNAVDAIVDLAPQLGADLLVLGSKGKGPLKATLTGSVVSKVVAQSGVPTVVVNARDK